MGQEQAGNRHECKILSPTVSDLSYLGNPPCRSISWGELHSIVFTQETSHLGGAKEWYSTAYKDPGSMWAEGIDLKDLC